MNSEKINYILQALNLREEVDNPVMPGMRTSKPTVTGEQRVTLIDELVRILTVSE